MNGEWLGSRAIRVNWANQKTQTGGSRSLGLGQGFNGPLTFEQVAAQTPDYNTTVYVGNLIPYTTQADLIPLFQNYGYIVEIRMQADRGFAFVKLDTHANAALSITSLQNQLVHGRPIKCSWGKDRQSDAPGYMVRHAFSERPDFQMYTNNYPYFPGYGGIPGQPGAQSPGPENGSAPPPPPTWDPAAAAAYYQTGGWGGFYSGSAKTATPWQQLTSS